MLSRGKITAAEKAHTQQNLHFTDQLSDCKADVIIEAIVEVEPVKIDLFDKLAAINSATCIFASNTSSLSINQLAKQIPYPERFIGMHFFNPAPLMKLVEVVAGTETNQKVVEAIVSLAERMGKIPVVCKDAPGFIVNHVARPYYLEGMKLVESGTEQIENVDAAMENAGFKMGPFRLMDLIGIDINYNVSKIVWEALSCPERLKPSDLQKSKFEAGHLGRKTGFGFYKYE